MKKLTTIDLFCGAGGLSEGLQQAGFNILAANDVDPFAAETFRSTHTGTIFFQKSVRELTSAELLEATGLEKGDLDCLVGGPPCQGYSVYNHQRGMHDERSHLFREYLRLVEGLFPRWLIMENVTGIMSAGEGEAFRAVLSGIRSLGYTVEARILRAEDYGVPQERRRVVFLANRVGLPIVWPQKTHGDGLKPYTTVFDAISDLPELENGQDLGATNYRHEARTKYQQYSRKGAKCLTNHAAPMLGEINIERIKFIPQGGSWRDIPLHLLPNGMKKAKRSDHTKRYGRMKWRGLACTILTKCDIHWGAYIHPEQNRSISMREAARLQSFPDKFDFKGPKTEQYVQIGNAVPPILARRLGEAILESENFEELPLFAIGA